MNDHYTANLMGGPDDGRFVVLMRPEHGCYHTYIEVDGIQYVILTMSDGETIRYANMCLDLNKLYGVDDD